MVTKNHKKAQNGGTVTKKKVKLQTVDALAITEKLGIATHGPKQRVPWSEEEDEKIRLYINKFLIDKGYMNGILDLQADGDYSKSSKMMEKMSWDDLAKTHFNADEDESTTSTNTNSLSIGGSEVKKRKLFEIKKRWYNFLDPNLKRGRWTPEEDELLLKMYNKYGQHWSKIAKEIPRRNLDQCSKRYYEALDPKLSQGRLREWTEEEDLFLISKVQQHGTKWKTISSSMESRPSLTCRNRWRRILTSVIRNRASEAIKSAIKSSSNINDLTKLVSSEDGSAQEQNVKMESTDVGASFTATPTPTHTPSAISSLNTSNNTTNSNHNSNMNILTSPGSNTHMNMQAQKKSGKATLPQIVFSSNTPAGPLSQKLPNTPKFPQSPLVLGMSPPLPLLDVMPTMKTSGNAILNSLDKAQVMLLDKSPSADVSMEYSNSLTRSTSNLRTNNSAVRNDYSSMIPTATAQVFSPSGLINHISRSGTPNSEAHLAQQHTSFSPGSSKNGVTNTGRNGIDNTNGVSPSLHELSQLNPNYENMSPTNKYANNKQQDFYQTQQIMMQQQQQQVHQMPQHLQQMTQQQQQHNHHQFSDTPAHASLDQQLHQPQPQPVAQQFQNHSPSFGNPAMPSSNTPGQAFQQTEWKFALKDKGYTLSSGVISTTELVHQLIEEAKNHKLKISIHQHIHNHYGSGQSGNDIFMKKQSGRSTAAGMSESSLISPSNTFYTNSAQSSNGSNPGSSNPNQVYGSTQHPSSTASNSALNTPKVVHDLPEIGHNRQRHFKTLNPSVRPKLGSSSNVNSSSDLQRLLNHPNSNGQKKKRKKHPRSMSQGSSEGRSSVDFTSTGSSSVSTPNAMGSELNGTKKQVKSGNLKRHSVSALHSSSVSPQISSFPPKLMKSPLRTTVEAHRPNSAASSSNSRSGNKNASKNEDEMEEEDAFSWWENIKVVQPLTVTNTENSDLMFGSTNTGTISSKTSIKKAVDEAASPLSRLEAPQQKDSINQNLLYQPEEDVREYNDFYQFSFNPS